MSDSIAPPEPRRHGIAKLLVLVGDVRRLANDTTLPPIEAMGRIRDCFAAYDEGQYDQGGGS